MLRNTPSRVGNLGELDPAMHYVTVGEALGYAPSDKFDPTYYLKRDPDLRGQSTGLLLHYLMVGIKQGRRPVSLASELELAVEGIDRARETILLICQEATRTGAPVFGYNIALQFRKKYNVVALLLKGGDLTASFQSACNAVDRSALARVSELLEMDYCRRAAVAIVQN